MDDILDFQGSEDRLGKPVANDLRQGIATLPVLLFAKKQPDHPTILKLSATTRSRNEEIPGGMQEIRSSGSIEAAMANARQFGRQAQAALGTLAPTIAIARRCMAWPIIRSTGYLEPAGLRPVLSPNLHKNLLTSSKITVKLLLTGTCEAATEEMLFARP